MLYPFLSLTLITSYKRKHLHNAMAHLQIHNPCILKGIYSENLPSEYRVANNISIYKNKKRASYDETPEIFGWRNSSGKKRKGFFFCQVKKCFSASATSSSSSVELAESRGYGSNNSRKDGFEVLLSAENHGWQVRRMVESEEEMRSVSRIQAEAFHEPVVLFNDLFFEFFQAEVLSGLIYRLRSSPPDRYACLVAEPSIEEVSGDQIQDLVGVVDVTVLRDDQVLQYLKGAEEYLYVSGIAVLRNFRRRKVATALLNACDKLAILWGFDYLVLRAYEDDWGARNLYENAGYFVVGRDPAWMTTWIGRRRRVLMIKRCNTELCTDEIASTEAMNTKLL